MSGILTALAPELLLVCAHLRTGRCDNRGTAEGGGRSLDGRIGSRHGATLTPYGWRIPSLSDADLVSERPVGARWLLAGDAAGLVDPITREGIFFALLSGQYAAEAIIDARSTEAYARQLRAHLYPELRRAARLKRGFFHAGFTPLLVDALRRSAPVRRVMADLVAGRQEYRTSRDDSFAPSRSASPGSC